MTATLGLLDTMPDACDRAMDPRRLSSYASVRFPVHKIGSARLLWINHGWFIERGVNVVSLDVRRQVEREILDQYAVRSAGPGEAELSECQWLEADLYGGTGGALHGGSGRCGLLGAFNAKGIGKTPLVATGVDAIHSSGVLSLKEAVREAVGAEICRKELPYGSVPVIAIIDTGLTQKLDPSTPGERCAIVVRPNFIRPAHFERSIFFGNTGTSNYQQYIDARRVHQSILTLGRECAVYPSVKEMFTRFARQLGAARAKRLWQGRFLSSNLSIDGALVDFGAFRSVPNWRKCIGLAGESFGTEVKQLRLAFTSVLYYFAKYSDTENLDFDFKHFYRQLAEIENDAFLAACLEGLGVARDQYGPLPLLEELLMAYYDVQQAIASGDDADGDPCLVYQLLSSSAQPAGTCRAEEGIARQLIWELDRLEREGLPVCRNRTRMFFDSRRRLKYANSVAAVTELERRLATASHPATLVRRYIENECSSSTLMWGSIAAGAEVLEQATDLASTVLKCRNLHSGQVELRGEGALIGGKMFILGQTKDVTDLKLERVVDSKRRYRFSTPLLEGAPDALCVDSARKKFSRRMRNFTEGNAQVIATPSEHKVFTHRMTGYDENLVETRQSAMFGHALRLLWAVDRKHVALSELSQRLWPAVLLKQIEFIFNSKGAPVGFVTWAFLGDDCARQLRANPDYVFHLSEWNEGDQLWLIDVVAMPGQVRNLLRKLREGRLREAESVQALRRRTDRGEARYASLQISRVQARSGNSLGNGIKRNCNENTMVTVDAQ